MARKFFHQSRSDRRIKFYYSLRTIWRIFIKILIHVSSIRTNMAWREQIMPNIVQQKLAVDLIRARMIDELFKRYVYQLRYVSIHTCNSNNLCTYHIRLHNNNMPYKIKNNYYKNVINVCEKKLL